MSRELEQARAIAERIARRVGDNGPTTPGVAPRPDVATELAAIRESLNELQNKLGRLEAQVISEPVMSSGYSSPGTADSASSPSLRTHSPWLVGVNAGIAHPSQEKFGVEEAAVSELVDFFEKEKTCSVEPGHKPCDHCSMCSSRGF